MKFATRTMLTLTLACLMATSLMAEDKEKKKKGKKKGGNRSVVAVRLPKTLNLNEEQQAKVAEVNKEYGPKLAELRKKMTSIIPPETQKARREAFAAARKAGKKGKELQEAVSAAIKLTDEQKKDVAEVQTAMRALQKEARDKVVSVLTDEQKKQFRAAAGGAKKGDNPKKTKKKEKNAE